MRRRSPLLKGCDTGIMGTSLHQHLLACVAQTVLPTRPQIFVPIFVCHQIIHASSSRCFGIRLDHKSSPQSLSAIKLSVLRCFAIRAVEPRFRNISLTGFPLTQHSDIHRLNAIPTSISAFQHTTSLHLQEQTCI
jgi:hypothetical protein